MIRNKAPLKLKNIGLSRRSLYSVVFPLFFFLGFNLLPSVPVQAEEITADLVEITTPVYKPNLNHFAPPLGSYTYQVSWQGIPAAEAILNVDRDGAEYRITSSARTYSAIDIFYKLRYQAEGIISAVDLLPIRSNFQQQENSRIKNISIQFLENGDIYAVRSQKNKDSKVLQFNPRNFTLDPFSAAFLARSMDWKEGDSRQFDTFNGKSRYLITLTAKGKTRIRVGNEERDVWIIVPSVKNLTDEKANSKLREAEIYVTDDSSHEIVQIASSVFIGTVTTKLVEFRPLAEQRSAVVAQRGVSGSLPRS